MIELWGFLAGQSYGYRSTKGIHTDVCLISTARTRLLSVARLQYLRISCQVLDDVADPIELMKAMTEVSLVQSLP